MKCLTKAECSKWLQELNIIERPYHNAVDTNYSFPLTTYTEAWAAQELARHLVDFLGEPEFVLLHIDDWSLYKPDQMALPDAIRRSHGEERQLVDAPGHLFDWKEKDELVGMFWLTLAFGWSSYLYSSANSNVIYSWEGEFIDIWCLDDGTRDEIKCLCDAINKASK